MSLYEGVLFSSPPPEGVIPNANAPYDLQATSLLVCIVIFTILAILSMGIRLFTRVRIVGHIAADDYIMIGALILSIVLSALIIDLLKWGLGRHLWDVPLSVLYGYQHFLFINTIAAEVFCAATGMAKCSILLFYLRIFPSKPFHIAIWALTFFTAAYSLASVFVNIFSCHPIQATWEIEYAAVSNQICINRPVFYFAQAGLGILTDFATVLAPIPVMWNLKLPFRQKVGVGAILSTGGFVCIISIIRLYSLNNLLNSTDLTQTTSPALMWCVIELNTSITGGCVVTFRPFFTKYFPRILGSSRGGTLPYGSTIAVQRSTRHYQLESLNKSDTEGRFGGMRKGGTMDTTIGPGRRNGNSSEELIIQNQEGAQRGVMDGGKGVGSGIVQTVVIETRFDDKE